MIEFEQPKLRYVPGPWYFDEDDGEIWSAGAASIARAYTPHDFPCLDEGDMKEAAIECRGNGLILAAAPRLLEACQALMEYEEMMDGAEGHGENEEMYWRAVRLARAAIADCRPKAVDEEAQENG